jgi:hypothetical protein
MIRSVTIMLCVTSALAGAIPQAVTTQADAARRQDISAIYSEVMTSGSAVNAIAAQTADAKVGTREMPIQQCVTLPPARATEWTEILAEVDANKPGTGTIPPDLKLQRPYVLLNNVEVQEFRNSKSNPKFQGAMDLFQFTDVYFSKNRTIAVVFVFAWRGPLAATWTWFALERTAAGKWEQRRQWAHCGAEA